MGIEEEYDIELENEAVEQIQTVGDAIEALRASQIKDEIRMGLSGDSPTRMERVKGMNKKNRRIRRDYRISFQK